MLRVEKDMTGRRGRALDGRDCGCGHTVAVEEGRTGTE